MACAPVPWLSAMTAARAARKNLTSGCTPGFDGSIPCDPMTMLARAQTALGRPISLDAYSIARNVASEAGTGTPSEKIAIAEAAINRARADRLSISRLVMRDGTRYARQSGTNPRVSSSQDPAFDDVVAAELALSGRTGNFARGATHYFAPRYYGSAELESLFSRWADGWGSSTVGLAWVGPLAGVRPREQLLLRVVSKDQARAAYAAGLAALRGEAPAEEPCQSSALGKVMLALGLAALAGTSWYVWRRR